jgi:hypothetical protein
MLFSLHSAVALCHKTRGLRGTSDRLCATFRRIVKFKSRQRIIAGAFPGDDPTSPDWCG